MNNDVIGISKTSSCVPLMWLASGLVVHQTLEKTSTHFLSSSPSCLASSHDGKKIAIADKKRIIILDNLKYEVFTSAIIQNLFYSSNGKFLVAVEEHGINIYSRFAKLIVSIPISQVISLDFDAEEEYLITVTRETIQKWDVKSLSLDDALKKCKLVKTLRLDSVIKDSRFLKVVWAVDWSRAIYAITDTGMLLVIKDNLWVDRWVDVKMSVVNCILICNGLVVVGGSFTRIFELDTLSYRTTLKRHEALLDKSRPNVISLHLVEKSVIATIYSNNNIDFWDIEDVADVKYLKRKFGLSESIISVHNSSSNSIITNFGDGIISIWDVENNANQIKIDMSKRIVLDDSIGHGGSAVLAVSELYGLIAYGNSEGLLKLYNLNEISQAWSTKVDISEPKLMIFSDSLERRILACMSADGTIMIFKTHFGFNLLQTLKDIQTGIQKFCFCKQAQKMVTVSCRSMIFRKWTDDKTYDIYLRLECETAICDIGYDREKDQLLCLSENRRFDFYSLENGEILQSFNAEYISTDITLLILEINCFKSIAAISCSDFSILLIDLMKGKKIQRFIGHSCRISGLRFSNDGSLLFSWGEDGILIVWQTSELKSIPRSSSENVLNFGSLNLPSEYFPAWARKHSQSDVPPPDRHIIPKGRWAQRISNEGVQLHSDTDLKVTPIAPFSEGLKMKFSDESPPESHGDEAIIDDILDLPCFDIVQRERWKLSKNLQLMNQNPQDQPENASPETSIHSLDLAGLNLQVAKKWDNSTSHDAGRLRSRSDYLEMKASDEREQDGVEAVGIIIKKGGLNSDTSPSINIGEFEDDDNDSQSRPEIIEDSVDQNKKENAIDNLFRDRKHIRHGTLGFVEAMVEQLEILRGSEAQNSHKITEIELELSKIGDLVKDALNR